MSFPRTHLLTLCALLSAAFEVCIARLYGGGPPLHLSPDLIPNPSQPLTPAFTLSSNPPSSSSPSPTPANHQPATPRFLLSLVATASFLGMPAAVAHALQLVLASVGPHTAVRYLNFAIGKGIGAPDDPGAGTGGGGDGAAVGLESVAEVVVDEEDEPPSPSKPGPGETQTALEQREKDTETITAKLSALSTAHAGAEVEVETPLPSPSIKKEAPSSPRSDTSSMDVDLGTRASSAAPTAEPAARLEPHYYYGTVNDKVGEAAACWLARWGADVLACEVEVLGGSRGEREMEREPVVRWQAAGEEGREKGRKRGLTAPSRFAPPEGVGKGKERAGAGMSVEGGAEEAGVERAVPVVWRRGGLSARWARGLLSSDALFVKGERERYDMAKAVVEMRRGVPPEEREEVEEEEMEWEELFRTGIYYENMSLDDMMAISKDVSPSTGQSYVPLSVLQSAHWNQDVLRHRITSRPRGGGSSPSSPPLSPSARDKELGLGVSGAGLQKETEGGAWYPVPGDSSVRIGDSTGVEGANTEQQLLELVSPPTLDKGKKSTRTCEENFFGLQQQRFSAAAASALGDGQSRYTPHPPFRFGVEFWDVDTLKEKSRLHSHTVWYAGSLYNVYVQVVRKKGVQLGVYLHRQSSVDPLPPCSAPAIPAPTSSTVGRTPAQLAAHSGRPASSSVSGSVVSSPRPNSMHSSVQGYSSSGLPILPLSRSTTPVSTPASPGLASSLPSSSSSSTLASAPAQPLTLPATAHASAPQQPYRDPRPAVSAYFAIACASATGASLTKFTSAPDVFSISQSWGWKSSSLRTDEYLEVGRDGMPRSAASTPARKEVSLRATVVLGVV
ncbi:uncharacterized protein C8Q71DRAFT_50166 [Rhodofomes roseus]|uniref:Uncharacterized protein n=1 Tax=Rhodofomes roseus TaxID=34475 RepID=A0ABQ8KH01_9APHY|nr:uncharacterized protein C8Q71DRAFT_50166 [Rhodofomes roseus]KAH9836613.1 hypothetical protein C8Q71DRAFT_50166 [Rhodofomes roseus]